MSRALTVRAQGPEARSAAGCGGAAEGIFEEYCAKSRLVELHVHTRLTCAVFAGSLL